MEIDFSMDNITIIIIVTIVTTLFVSTVFLFTAKSRLMKNVSRFIISIAMGCAVSYLMFIGFKITFIQLPYMLLIGVSIGTVIYFPLSYILRPISVSGLHKTSAYKKHKPKSLTEAINYTEPKIEYQSKGNVSCSLCGGSILTGNTHCPKCGKGILDTVHYCPVCKTPHLENTLYCENCGESLYSDDIIDSIETCFFCGATKNLGKELVGWWQNGYIMTEKNVCNKCAEKHRIDLE